MSDLATLPREVYQELWAGLDMLEEELGKSSRVTVAREWLKKAAQQTAQPRHEGQRGVEKESPAV